MAVGVTGGLPSLAEFFHMLSFSVLDWVAELVRPSWAAQGAPGSDPWQK